MAATPARTFLRGLNRAFAAKADDCPICKDSMTVKWVGDKRKERNFENTSTPAKRAKLDHHEGGSYSFVEGTREAVKKEEEEGHLPHDAVIVHDGHVIGRSCIRKWVNDGHNTCPLCRKELFTLPVQGPSDQDHPNFTPIWSQVEREHLATARDLLFPRYMDAVYLPQAQAPPEHEINLLIDEVQGTLNHRRELYNSWSSERQLAINATYAPYDSQYGDRLGSDLPDERLPVDFGNLSTALLTWFDCRFMHSYDIWHGLDMRHHPLAPAYYYAAYEILEQWESSRGNWNASPRRVFARLMAGLRSRLGETPQRLMAWVRDICMVVALTHQGLEDTGEEEDEE